MLKMKVWLRYLLLLFLCVPMAAYPQKQQKNIVMYRDPVTGVDTLIAGVTLSEGDVRKMQYEIRVRTRDGKTLTFSAKDIRGYRVGKKTLHSRQVEVDGEVRHVLLPRLYGQDSVAVYSFVGNDGKRRPYVQLSADPMLMPLADAADARRVNPRVLAYFKSFPIASDEWVEAFIDRMKPTAFSLEKRHQVCRTGNPNHITRFRWGVMLGGGLGKVVTDGFEFDAKLQGSVGLFADVPVYQGLSVRPEVMFSPYGYKGQFPSEVGEVNAVYNRKDVSAALMFRYTMRSFTGRWLPFVQLGPQLNCVLDKEMESAERWTDSDGFTELTHHRYAVQKGTSLGVSGGVGVEYVVSARHSLFIDLRYSHELDDESLRGISLVLSFNL